MKLTIGLLATASVFLTSNTNALSSINRRQAAKAFTTAAAFGLSTATNSAYALEQCKPGANNCIQGTVSAPSGRSKADVVADLRSALNAYPQAGQNGVDEGGWNVATDDLDGSGAARVEYRSSGKGNFAKFFNGGKPFVDDLKLEINDSGDSVAFKSASRVGDSDFGVNGKRMDYIKSLLQDKGWSI